jgi:hypothetical protein
MISHAEMFQRIQREERRLCALLYLVEAPQGHANAYTLQRVLRKMGHVVEHELVLEDIAWLAGMGLVRSEALPPDITVASITPKGRDAAAGEISVPGVAVPLGV